ncbi:E3 SUMO-protein ligase KIAA1586-like [Ranitomeya variabilis]|uniref:E3 SUMO-protein ligase KIAA1586-like n=1 Tax=Ranitomeya variabilis TaxID=490064 RepID=UPI0040559FC6
MKRQSTLLSFFHTGNKKGRIEEVNIGASTSNANKASETCGNIVHGTNVNIGQNTDSCGANALHELDSDVQDDNVRRNMGNVVAESDVISEISSDVHGVADVLCDHSDDDTASAIHDSSIVDGQSSVSDASLETQPLSVPCWSQKQIDYFTNLHPWVKLKDGKLGCTVCSKVGSSLGAERAKSCHLSEEWKTFSVKPCGTLKKTQQSSFRKKIREHAMSKAHNKAEEIVNAAKNDALVKALDRVHEKALASTVNVFHVVYSLALHNRPMSDIQGHVELLQTIGVDLGVGLHSRKTAITIIQHISSEMRKSLFSKIISFRSKFSIVTDESSTVSQKSVLVIYIRCELPDAPEPVNIFVDLKELECTSADSITNALFACLKENGFDQQYMQGNLIGFCSDGASAMLGSKVWCGFQNSKSIPKCSHMALLKPQNTACT